MTHLHEPDPDFARFLEWQTTTELRRIERFAPAIRAAEPKAPGSGRLLRFARVAAIIMASSLLGASGVLAAQEVQRSKLAERLLSAQEIEASLAEAKVAAAQKTLAVVTSRHEEGYVSAGELAKARRAAAHETSALQRVTIDTQEIELTSRAPDHSLDAPVIAGRDFSSERFALQLSSAESDLALAKERHDRTRLLAKEGYVSALEERREQVAVDKGMAKVALWTETLRLRAEYNAGKHEPAAVVRLGRLARIDEEIAGVKAEAAFLKVSGEKAKTRESEGLIATGSSDAIGLELAEVEARRKLLELERAAYAGI